MTRGWWMRGLAAALVLAGCANTAPVQTATGGPGDPTAVDTSVPDPAASLDPGVDDTPVASPDPVASPSPSPSPDAALPASPAPTPSPELSITDQTMTTSGILLWKHCTVNVTVANDTSVTLSGELAITFRKGTAIVETYHKTFTDMAPGDAQPLSVKSTQSADSADVLLATSPRSGPVD